MLDIGKESVFVRAGHPPAASSRGSRRFVDYWRKVPGRWIFVHRGPRRELLHPQLDEEGLSLLAFSGERLTYVKLD
eukprot:7390711-Lingulodinium_polyedra.AAC.1